MIAPKGRKYANTTERELAAQQRIRRVVMGLLRIAKIAMPDTYFATDRRVRAAQKLLRDL